MNKVQFVAEQLRKIAPRGEWDQGGVDRASELARIFVRNDITDLWALKLIPVSYVVHTPAYWHETEAGGYWEPEKHETIKTFAFEYYGRKYGFLGLPERPENREGFEISPYGALVAWSAVGKGHINYVVRPNAEKTAIEIVPIWGSSSDAGAIRSTLVTALSFFASLALPLAGVSLGTAIGNAVLPASIASAYPVVSSIVGNVALSTALNGGDVEAAVKGALTGAASGFAGAEVGSFLQSATNSTVIANLADAVTRTAISGGDIKTAAGLSLFREGVNMFDFSSPAPTSSGFDFFSGGDFGGSIQPSLTDYDFVGAVGSGAVRDWGFIDPSLPLPEFNFDKFPTDSTAPLSDFDFVGYVGGGANDFQIVDSSQWNPFGSAAPSGIVAPPATAPQSAPPASSPTFNPTQIIQGISAAGMAVISLIKAYRQLDKPQINYTARVVRPDGSVSAITSNGLVSTRTPDGRVTTTRAPVGVPQTTVDGNVIVNNGDGTYTVVSQTGQSATYRYAAGSGSISPGALALVAGIGFLLLKR